MADRTQFTDQEWETLRDAPHLTAIAVASSGSSGFFGTLKEAMSASSALLDGHKSENTLVASLNTREEIKTSQAALRARVDEMKKGVKDGNELREKATSLALTEVQAALDILKLKGLDAEFDAYRSFVQNTGQRVAEAAKEGAFLGFGGERVSEAEVAVLNQLKGVLS